MSAFTPRHFGTPGSVATAYDHGAHVASWLVDDVPVVWVSRRSTYTSDAAIRGGIPVCWPWFANGPSGDQTPSHGLVRTAAWTLGDHTDSRAQWVLSSGDWPDAYEGAECTLEAQVEGRSLRVAHTVTNTGGDSMSYEVALHTYLHVGDVRDVSVNGLDDVAYFDKVTQTQATQAGDVRIRGEVDRIYDASGPVDVLDPTLERMITVTNEGAQNVVVWNPGPEGAHEMADFADEEWTQMVCVETANIGERRVHLAPGDSHTTALRLDAGVLAK